MKIPHAIAMALLTGFVARAGNIPTSAYSSLNVCVARMSEIWIVTQAETLAAQMFAEIGVSVEWYHDDRHCKAPPSDFLTVTLSAGEHDSTLPGALAYTRLHDKPHIEVFYDRIAESVDPRQRSRLLAHVLSHEITHLLEDVNRHSSTGLMKAHWDGNDLMEMSAKPLSFGPEDVDLIHRALVQRGLRHWTRR